jgi:hypothetical protein
MMSRKDVKEGCQEGREGTARIRVEAKPSLAYTARKEERWRE